jgi:hypothetical protein
MRRTNSGLDLLRCRGSSAFHGGLSTAAVIVSASEVIPSVLSILGSLVVAYLTATHALRRQQFHGKARLLDICRRYLINFVNAFDRRDKRNLLRQDALAYRLYVTELQAIVEDLQALLANPYVEKLLIKHPRSSKLLQLLRRELVEHSSCEDQKLHGLNVDSLKEVLDLMDVLRREVAVNSDDPFEREIVEVAKTLRGFCAQRGNVAQ